MLFLTLFPFFFKRQNSHFLFSHHLHTHTLIVFIEESPKHAIWLTVDRSWQVITQIKITCTFCNCKYTTFVCLFTKKKCLCVNGNSIWMPLHIWIFMKIKGTMCKQPYINLNYQKKKKTYINLIKPSLGIFSLKSFIWMVFVACVVAFGSILHAKATWKKENFMVEGRHHQFSSFSEFCNFVF